MLDPKKQQIFEQASAEMTEVICSTLGSMRRRFVEEGFDKLEAFILCKQYLEQYLDRIFNGEKYNEAE